MELTKAFGKCVRSAAAGALPDRAQMLVLEEIILRYPWFTTARLLYSHGSGMEDPALKLHMLAYPRPDFMLAHISPEELGLGMPAEAPEPKSCPAGSQTGLHKSEREFPHVATPPADREPKAPSVGLILPKCEPIPEPLPEDPIDKFLSWDGHRITPDETATDDDAAAESAQFELTDDLISEDLAEIYLAQGLNRQAQEIYQRLCLLNPEKSVYFASIIDKITLGDN